MRQPSKLAHTLARLAPILGATVALLLAPMMLWAAVNSAFRGLR